MRILFKLTILFYVSCKTAAVNSALKNEIQQYNLEKVDTLVDIGCGNAYHDWLIFQTYPNLFLVLEDLPLQANYQRSIVKKKEIVTKERVASMLKNSSAAPTIESHFQLVLGSDDSIPLPSSKYKRVLCRRTLHEFKDKGKMISEMVRILSNDGVLTIVEIEPKYSGEKDPYCKSTYLTKEEIILMFPQLHLKGESSVGYPEHKLNILSFSK